MDWLTQEEIKEAAKSKRTAIRCSRLHWEQMKDAAPEELEEGCNNNRTSIRSEHCTLCRSNNASCKDKEGSCCVLFGLVGETKCGPEYHAADVAFNNRHKNWQAWKEAATKMWQRLCDEEAKCDIECPEAKEEEREIKFGDRYAQADFSGRFFVILRQGRGNEWEIFHNQTGSVNNWSESTIRRQIYIDNIFDDLSGPDLEEFELGYKEQGEVGDKVRMRLCGSGDIEIKVPNMFFTDEVSTFQKLHRKLGRLIIKAKKKDC